MVVTMQPNGELSLYGPLNDKVLCLGMLEFAKTAVLSAETKPKIAIPPADMLAELRMHKNGKP